MGAKCLKNVQMIVQILNLLTNTDILAPELVGDQSEMVVWQFFHLLADAFYKLIGPKVAKRSQK